jgi:hypothetical protein
MSPVAMKARVIEEWESGALNQKSTIVIQQSSMLCEH